MKHINRFRIFAAMLAVLTCSGSLLTFSAHAAEEKNDEAQKNAEYEAKKSRIP